MKKRILASLLSLCLLAGLLPTVALAADGEPDSGVQVCSQTDACPADTHSEDCPLYKAPKQPPISTEIPEGTGNSNGDVQPNGMENLAGSAIQMGGLTASTETFVTGITEAGGELISGAYTLSDSITFTTANLTIPAGNEVTIDLNGYTLTGNGSGSVITVNGTLTIKDSGSSGSITGGVAQSGGGLYVGATGTVNLTGGTITGNAATSTTSTDGGSGVYIAEGGSMTMTGGAVSGNNGSAEADVPTAVRGGGIYTNGTLIVTGGTISSNTGKAGGGVYVYKQGTFTMSEDAKIIENNAVGENSAQGGGVFNFGTLTMNGGTICNNKAGKHGGGICTNTAFKMTGGSITGNSVTCVGGSESETGLGGGVFVNGNASFEMTGGSVTKNTAQTAGGGVWVANQMGVSGSIVVAENTSGEVASNVGLAAGKMLEIADALASNASIGVHLAAESGHVTQNSKTLISQDTLRVITADSSTDVFQIGQDGEVWCNMDDIIADPSEAEAKIGEVYYKTFNSAWENLPIGGSEITILKSLEINEQYVLSQGADVTLTATDEVTISCKAVTPAPDSYFKVSTYASLTLSGTLVLNGTDGSCRAIRVNDYGTFTLTDNAKICSFKNTDTKIGGGAIAASGKNAKVLISGGTLSDNKNESATSGGGAIYCVNGILTISGGTIQNNASVSRGGGIYTISGNTAISNDALISGNSVTGTNEYGGGLVINNGKATMTGGTISKNTAHTAGSVAVLGSGSFEMSGGSIQENTTSGGVGSIYIIKNASMTMSGGSITQNTASSGGGIANYGTLILTGSGIISKNTIEATKNSAGGGGVYNGGSFTMNGGTISENTVKNKSGTKATNLRGAGVLNYTNGTFILNAGEISGNKFAITDESTIGGGGGIYNLGSCTINGGSIQGHGTENTVFGGAGVFSNYSSASLTISGGEIKNNYSGNNLGSGVRANSGSFAMTGGSITDNTGVSGLYVEPTATFSISGDPIVIGNKNTSNAEKNLYLKDNQHITLSGPMAAGAAIGVTTATNPTGSNSVQITAAESGTEFYKDAAQYFIPDVENAIAEADNDNKYVNLSYTNETYYDVTLELTNLTPDKALVTRVKKNKNYTATLTADTGYHLPDTISEIEGVTYDKEAGTITISSVSGDMTVTAAAVPNTYKVKFDANGGEGNQMAEQTMTYDQAATLTENTYTKEGFNFAGWSTTADETCEYLDRASVINLTAVDGDTVPLYAVWTTKLPYPVTITADPANMTGGGTVTLTTNSTANEITVTGVTCDDSSITVVKNENGTYSAVLPNVTKTYTFTATVTGDLDSYADGSATCIVSVTHRSSGGGGGSATYSVTVDKDVENGTVTVSPKNASKGKTVTITVTPDDGYELGELIVSDRNGNELKLTDKGNGKYTFTMPSGKVSVEASFVESKETPSARFVDVSADAYYADAVAWAVKEGITSGTSANTFSPNAACTRSQMVTFLWRAAGSPKATGGNPFADVDADAYYYDAILWAVEQGITSGTSATTFSPDTVCTRGQMATFLYRFEGTPAVTGSNPFGDVAADAFYADAVTWAVADGITVGTGSNTFSPNANCTRGQMVTFLYRCLAEK